MIEGILIGAIGIIAILAFWLQAGAHARINKLEGCFKEQIKANNAVLANLGTITKRITKVEEERRSLH